MKPLYATGGPGGSDVAKEIASITIPPADTRLGQIIRNDLLSTMRTAENGGGDRYTLELVTGTRESKSAELDSLGAERRAITLNVTYRLKEIASSKVVSSGRTFSQVSYDETGQSFADLRARDSALERAAHEVSQDIRSRLAAHFAAS
jgi:LPS-assembly lipoprotein